MKQNKIGLTIQDHSKDGVAEAIGLSEDRMAIIDYRIRKATEKYHENESRMTEIIEMLAGYSDDVNEFAYAMYGAFITIGRMKQREECCSKGGFNIEEIKFDDAPDEVKEVVKMLIAKKIKERKERSAEGGTNPSLN